jgi:hypothetical protein
MKNAKLLKAYDLIREIKDIDSLIESHHRLSNDSFMTDQYQARKDKLFAQLVTLLAQPSLASSVSYRLIRQLVEKYYATDIVASLPAGMTDEWQELERLVL